MKKFMDLRGTCCPYNWVKVKLELEEVDNGDQLEVLLDDGEPIRNVPRSVTQEGHALLKVTPEGEHFRLLIEKRGEK
ncbi:MAG: sulfurtransferase TusA family protein [Dehalococcoidia bacterium]|nr:sulfurtransferase TusA family protein [Dehalococcoidia bacterium]